MRYILHVKKNTPNVMLYGDLGRFPLSVTVKKRIIGYWFDLLTGDKLSAVLYKHLLNYYKAPNQRKKKKKKKKKNNETVVA